MIHDTRISRAESESAPVRVDTIIVGRGLSGSLLGWMLIQRGQKVLIVDRYHRGSASKVAAGIINPVTGPRLTPCWRIETLLPFARRLYREISDILGQPLYTDFELVRIFKNDEERRIWMHRRSQSGTAKYLGSMRYPGWRPNLITDPFGSFSPGGSGYLTVSRLIDGLTPYFTQKANLMEAEFRHEDLQLTTRGVKWRDWEAERVIFCEGYRAEWNPFSRWLPFKSSKGEVLLLKAESRELPNAILNRSKWLLPTGEKQLYRAGSTFIWDRLDGLPTDSGRRNILTALRSFIQVPLKTVGQAAGVRPTVKDRRPVLGLHPRHPQIGIFNGMGGKGALAAPFFADHLASFLTKGTALDSEVDISRFRHLL